MKEQFLDAQITQIASKYPHKIAIKGEERSITYSELERRSNQVANFLKRRVEGIPHVMIILDRSPELIVSILGVLKSGFVFVPVTPSFPANRIKRMAAETGIRWVITDTKYYQGFKNFFRGSGGQKNGTGLKTLLVDAEDKEIEDKKNNFCLEPSLEGEKLEFERVYNKNCYIYFTSGSTGVPKGVLGRQRSLIHFIRWEIKEFGIDEHFNISQMTPPSFDPFLRDIFVPLMVGGTSCIPHNNTLMNIPRLIRWIDNNDITLIHTVPSLFKRVSSHINDPHCFRHLKYILLAGELVRGRDLHRFLGLFNRQVQLVNVYGPTETTLARLFYRVGPRDANRSIIPVGKPIEGTQVLILDSKKQKCRPGKKGEIYIRTPFISSGYINDPGLTAAVFIKNPYGKHPKDIIYKSGDQGRLLPDGNIELSGRVDFQVKIHGNRIEMGEIENRLLTHGSVKETVVTAREDENHDRYLCAFVVAAPGKKITAKALREYLAQDLPRYMIPAYFIFLRELPLSSHGKVDRTMLPDPKAPGMEQGTAYEPPVDLVEEKIANTWKQLLQLDQVGVNSNFFDLGGNSLKIMEMNVLLSKEFKKEIPAAKLFEHTTIRSLAQYLRETKEVENPIKTVKRKHTQKGTGEIAVIGMSCRFPGANNIEEYWNLLEAGKETISFSTEEKLLEAGLTTDLVNHPDGVKAVSTLPLKGYFDAAFFDYTPKEAELMDPQIRLFHECAWEAFEDGGIVPGSFAGTIGVYAGAIQNLEWERRVHMSGKGRSFGAFAASKFSGIRYLCTRLSYNLNLKGPSVTLQTACSTSLAAIHMACKALLDAECDTALAGGVTASPQEQVGYRYEEGMIFSADGHCRSFDAAANGTIFGEGAGVVLLKPLVQALTDRDHIYAVIKGSAINNDGNRKVGFTAPSVSGQVEVIRAALHMAGIEPESIGYIEAHGTATTLGDPIEIEALTQVFNTHKKQSCKIGSVKSNFGHLDAAAGAAGFIKTVLSLKHKMIPPTLHFETPNPKIDFHNSPFEVNAELTQWKNEKYPLRAGVSSLGMGGTNAHVILQEAPRREKSPAARPYQIILLSAKSENSLNMAAENLAGFLKKNPGINLADVAYTLQTGRKRFNLRRMLVCSGIDEAIDMLSPQESNRAGRGSGSPVSSTVDNRPVVFMFPGQGGQYMDMGLGLYQTEPGFRQEMDRCFEILDNLMDVDIKEILYPASSHHRSDMSHLNQTEITQPVIFVFEYALAKLLMKWGIKPAAMIGHSIGEYVAACLAGVISLEDSLKLVALRGKLMQQVPSGSMLGVTAPESELLPLLKSHRELALAAVNSWSLCVVSGPDKAIETFAEKLRNQGCETRKIKTSHAFHSSMMDPVLEEFREALKHFHFNEPQIPYVSNLTGSWLSAAEVKDPSYWLNHLRQTVRFARGLETLFTKKNTIFIEIGPGNTLSKFAQQHEKKTGDHTVLNLVKHPREKACDIYYLLNKIGQMWLYGQEIDWGSFYSEEKRNRISLPSYAFDRKYYWIHDTGVRTPGYKVAAAAPAGKKRDIADWFYIPSWKRSVLLPADKKEPGGYDLVFSDDRRLSPRLLERFEQYPGKIIQAKIGPAYREVSESLYILDPGSSQHYRQLFKSLYAREQIPGRIIHLWNVTGDSGQPLTVEKIRKARYTGFYSLLNIARAIGNIMPDDKIEIIVITDNMQEVDGTDNISPGKSLILGPIQVIPQEYGNISCRGVDIDLSQLDEDSERFLNCLHEELIHNTGDRFVAYRRYRRWIHILEPVKLNRLHEIPVLLKPNRVYLITGGLGGIGLVLAEYLAKAVKPKLIITGRGDFPAKTEWKQWQQQHRQDPGDEISLKIRKLESMEKIGAEIFYLKVDVSHRREMEQKLQAVEENVGQINGIIHAAGVADYAGIIHRRTEKENENVFVPKLAGTLVLENILGNRTLDFFVLCSSMSSLCAHFGQVGYSSANAFLDAFARYKTRNGKTFTISINWDSWAEVGMAVQQSRRQGNAPQDPRVVELGILSGEGIEAFSRGLDHHLPNLAVSTIDFDTRLQLHQMSDKTLAPGKYQQEKTLSHQEEYLATSSLSLQTINNIEEQMRQIWQELLGHEGIDIHENFFELGGDSLTAVAVKRKVMEVFNIDIPLVKLYHYPTIHSFAKSLIEKGESENNHNHQQGNLDEDKEDLTEILEKFEEV